jgi:hypothetical protein
MKPSSIALTSLTVCCAPEFPLPTVDEEPDVELRLVVDPVDRGAEVVRLFLEGPSAREISPADVGLFEGETTSAQLEKWAEGVSSASLADRQIPSTVFYEGAERLVVVPHKPLRLASLHTVALPQGSSFTFWTSEDAAPFLKRVWPPLEVAVSDPWALYCGSDSIELDPVVGTLDPSGPRGVFAAGSASGIDVPCVYFVAEDATVLGRFHPPRAVDRWALEPTPLDFQAGSDPVQELACESEERPFGPGCALVEDDRMRVRTPEQPMVWLMGEGDSTWLATSENFSQFVVRGLEPASQIAMSLEFGSAVGRATASLELQTSSPRAHVHLSEVMANPDGPEPAQEWIELWNDGVAAADLSRFTLADSAGSVPLPSVTLGPGGRALLVREDFDASQLPEEALALVIRVSSLGGNGLSNEGELITLLDEFGKVATHFPKEPKPKPGESVSLVLGAMGEPFWVRSQPTPLAENVSP